MISMAPNGIMKAERRDKKREKRRKMKVTGRSVKTLLWPIVTKGKSNEHDKQGSQRG